MDTRDLLHQRLAEAFAGAKVLDVIDQSAAHRGHSGSSGGGHFQVIIVSAAFDGLSRVQRQRRVYETVADEMQSAVHALSMTCLTPREFEEDR